jgi:poly(beta-D-mannuronate) lyase
MLRILLLKCCLLSTIIAMANTVIVKNIDELNEANKKALPGDIVILQNGEWKNVTINLDCSGTQEKPVTFKAQTPGKVLITGNSKLKLGGNFIVVDGFYFTNGYGGDDVISYRVNSKQLANNCRVTNTVVNNFNNPKRMDENYWVAFYGKNNRLDHCSFIDKKNLGVLLAVVLDDERSRENFHSIDHNYFGRRPALASNGGEIMRVGVSQHCQFNSNTQIKNNFFESCDGETEIVSIKSCANVIQENIFKECQGSVVLRHGDNNLVAGNYFLGNDKTGTGGVRVINKGQKVLNNIFYKCRGVDFRSPLAIMNGIPNSPANRYVQVINAEISNNLFYECAPLSFCEGSDTERTLPPDHVIFEKNIFYNKRDHSIYTTSDNIDGFIFAANKVSREIKQTLNNGFEKTMPDITLLKKIAPVEKESYQSSGALWFSKQSVTPENSSLLINCSTATQVYAALARKEDVTIRLTGKDYKLTSPFIISKKVRFTGDNKTLINISSAKMLSAFLVEDKGNLSIENLKITGPGIKATHFISNDTSGNVNHFNITIQNSTISDLHRNNDCRDLLYIHKYMLADSIVIRNNSFINNYCNFFIMADEKEDKGYYNAERIVITQNTFNKQQGSLLNIYRGGNDESTLGPNLTFSNNDIRYCNAPDSQPLIRLTGVQVTRFISNKFSDCNQTATLILYKDVVRAKHFLEKNIRVNSGVIETNQFVMQKD